MSFYLSAFSLHWLNSGTIKRKAISGGTRIPHSQIILNTHTYERLLETDSMCVPMTDTDTTAKLGSVASNSSVYLISVRKPYANRNTH